MLNRLRFFLAINVSKFVKQILRLTGRKGTTLPGAIALRICPDILSHFGSKLNGNVVLITGTNGKTTTSNLLTHFLRKDGRAIISNSLGANLIQGIVTTFLDGYKGKAADGQAVVLEVDEATIGKVIQPLHPNAVVVTNFFRDQMDRYGEVDTVVELVGNALKKAPDHTMLILNADDPLVSSIAPEGKRVIWYGINSSDFSAEDHNEVKDGKFCRTCSSPLHYTQYHYGQLGFYRCLTCGFQRANPDYAAERVRLHEEGILFELKGDVGRINSPALYNVYNALAAITAANLMGVKREVLREEMSSMATGLGRMERMNIAGKHVMLTLVKNPTGFNQVLSVVQQETRPAHLVVVLNDHYADGTDVSWIWDTNIEKLRKMSRLQRIWATGTRAFDMGVRLKYAGFGDITEVMEGDIRTVDHALAELPEGHLLYILSTYTSLYAIRDHLLAKGRIEVEAKNRASVPGSA
ncbi:UDP-N-acetylmuramyl peptide synthase [Collibacillus ludicampi]|uniref:Lipid II isoglutaminyl synthase (glutamine-hydrolyzing) subunit MurT n=1 Tax=Collibacillus ludicampi TaxID=2771369 RepID=A0AAV4LKE5_9BACL|nr:UDP-N-acetylmuramyl peptide synthase [Collibacillus ludicampi]